MTTVETPPSTGALPRWLWGAMIGAGLLYGVPSVWLLFNFIQQAYDVGIFDQTLWLIVNGESFNTVAGIHVLGDHFSPILFVISPLALVPGGAAPELIFQSLLIASGVIPAYKLAVALDRDPRWFVLVYAIHPAMVTGSWTGWRPWNLAVPFFMWACYFVVRRPTSARIVISGLVLLVFREDLALWVGLLALILYLDRRLKLRNLILSGLALGTTTALVLFVALPALSPMDGYFFAGDFTAGPDLGQLVSSISIRVVFLLLPLAIAPSRINWRLMGALGLPVLGLVLRGGPSLTTFFQYDMMFVPLLLVVVALSPPVEYRPVKVAVASLVVMLLFGALRPFPPQHGPNPFLYNSELATDYRAVLSELYAMDDFMSLSISAPDTLVPHLSERRDIFMYPWPADTFSDPDNVDSRLSFDCPPPEVLAQRPDLVTQAWVTVLEETPHQQVGTFGQMSVWRAVDPVPEGECTARYSAG